MRPVGHEVANRRIFYDFTFSPPKSVSIAALVGNDPRIVDAHHRGVEAALRELEQFAGTRVHAGERMTDRTTANIVCAIFRHDTSRALDPHLHSHCIVFNATRDPSKAGGKPCRTSRCCGRANTWRMSITTSWRVI